MGKGISRAEYEVAVKQMASCSDKNCSNGNKSAAVFCRACKQNHKLTKEYDRLNRRAE